MQVASTWSDSTLTMDGLTNRWTSSLVPIKDSNVNFGARNDQDYLYLCLESPDQQFARQIAGAGMTVWFESKAGQKIGIRYPLGFAGGRRLERSATTEDERVGEETPDGRPTSETRSQSTPDVVKELVILGPGKNETNRFPLLEAPGIQTWFGRSEGLTLYEVKVPLKQTAKHPYAIAAAPGSTVNIDFETGKAERPSQAGGGEMSGGPDGQGGRQPGRDPGGFGPGGEGPMGGKPDGGVPEGGMRGGRRGRGGRGGGNLDSSGRTNRPQQFELKADVTLASGPTGRHDDIHVDEAH